MNEIWKDVPEYEGLYQASNLGNIRGPKGWNLKPGIDKKTGYSHVILCKNGNKGKYVHRLVWEAFNGPIPPGLEVNHIDEKNKQDNSLSNLELLTHKQNMNYGTITERRNLTMRERGHYGKQCKRVAQVDREYKLIKIHSSLTKACNEVGAKLPNISACCKDKNKFAKGFHWVIVPPDCQDVEELIRNHFE